LQQLTLSWLLCFPAATYQHFGGADTMECYDPPP
jgi:hypothetical protein